MKKCTRQVLYFCQFLKVEQDLIFTEPATGFLTCKPLHDSFVVQSSDSLLSFFLFIDFSVRLHILLQKAVCSLLTGPWEGNVHRLFSRSTSTIKSYLDLIVQNYTFCICIIIRQHFGLSRCYINYMIRSDFMQGFLLLS